METANIQLTDENIKFIKSIATFSKVVNTSLEIIRTDPELHKYLVKRIAEKSTGLKSAKEIK